ncbi:MAG: preprotein translocase subunit YajC [Dehalococcoidia bacterium]|nr:preprotein translocase subunit YajC [Dehalococcoidia bacterium]
MDTTTWIMVGFLVVMFAGFYFMMVRPQRKRQQDQAQLAANIKVGDRVITWSGIYGEVIGADDDTLVIKVESGASFRMARMAVAQKQLEDNK